MWQGDSGATGSGRPRLHESTADLWREPRVLVPGTVSLVALTLTLATVCTCVRRSKFLIYFKP